MATLNSTLLGRIPPLPRRYRRDETAALLVEFGGAQAEAFALVRTSLELATIGSGARVFAIASALHKRGRPLRPRILRSRCLEPAVGWP